MNRLLNCVVKVWLSPGCFISLWPCFWSTCVRCFFFLVFIYDWIIVCKALWNLAWSLSFYTKMKAMLPWRQVKAPLICFWCYKHKTFPQSITGSVSDDSNWLTPSCMDFTLGTRPSILIKSIQQQAEIKLNHSI